MRFATRQIPSVPYDDVFVGYDAVQADFFAGEGVLHQDAVSDHGILADFYSAEYHGVFDSAFDHAAVGDERVFYYRAFGVFCGRRIAYLGEDGSAGNIEKLLSYS